MDDPLAVDRISHALRGLGASELVSGRELLVLCIGSDRSIGDSLGPLIGSALTEGAAGTQSFSVLGTLDRPIHAGNLFECMGEVGRAYRNPLVLAVDACLGRSESVGILTVGKGSLKPGAGVNKALPAVGSLYLTGVVNVGGFMEYFVLQNTRLSFVMRMARIAAEGIRSGLSTVSRAVGEAAARSF